MALSVEELCESLGYTPKETLRRTGPGDDVSIHATAPDGNEVIVRFYPCSASASGSSGLSFDTKRWNTSRFNTAGGPAATDADGSAFEDRLNEMALRWTMATASGGKLLSPVIEFGQIDRFAFQVRPHYPLTLRSLIEKQVSPNPLLLFRVVEQVWTALAFLHQVDINQPHGNISPSNVAFGPGSPAEADLFLIDLRESTETKRAEFKRTDYQNLGLLIYRFASSFEGQIDAVDALVRCQNVTWSQLGKFEKGWRELTRKLLDPDHYPAGHDMAAEREKALSPLLPPKTRLSPVPELQAVNSEPPVRATEDTPAQPVHTPAELAEEIETHLQKGELAPALDLTLRFLAAEPSRTSQVVSWCDRIATAAPPELCGNSEFLDRLEQAAKTGSTMSALRLGEALVEKYPGEALPWLEQAASAGLHSSLPLLAHAHEWGGDGLEKNPAKAYEYYKQSIVLFDDSDLTYRAAALVLREPSLNAQAAEATRSLDAARKLGNFRATDLLGQCCAHGIGLHADEKRAFELFTEAWNTSKKSNEHYFTASNNLGVCFAIGFGTRKDPDLARHYFKQGEIAGHEASKKNLQNLLQNR